MYCQLRTLWEAGMTRQERLRISLGRRVRRLRTIAHTVRNDPVRVLRKARRVVGMERRVIAPRTGVPTIPPLALQPGDRVRVKLAAEIRATLDSGGRCERLYYNPSTMDRYCGGVYTVVKRIDRFYDEYSGRMLSQKNTVILDKVYCEPDPGVEEGYAGCTRMCFLFWKEAWLERVSLHERVEGQ